MGAPTADLLIPAAAPTHPLRDTHSLTERHFCEICANVWTGRLGSIARGLVPQMARCWRHQKTVFHQSPHATNYMGRSPKAELQCNAEPKPSNANPSQGTDKATRAGKSHLEQRRDHGKGHRPVHGRGRTEEEAGFKQPAETNTLSIKSADNRDFFQ